MGQVIIISLSEVGHFRARVGSINNYAGTSVNGHWPRQAVRQEAGFCFVQKFSSNSFILPYYKRAKKNHASFSNQSPNYIPSSSL